MAPSSHRVHAITAISLLVAGCDACRAAPPPVLRSAPASNPVRDAGAPAPQELALGDIVFAPNGRFVVFASANGSRLVDVRARRGIARTTSGRYRTAGQWTTLGLSSETNPGYPLLGTVDGGRFAVIESNPPELDELATGTRTTLAKGAEVHELYSLVHEGPLTRIHLHGGRDIELAGQFEVVKPWLEDVLVSPIDDAHTRFADPATGRTLDLPTARGDVSEARWAAPDRSRLAMQVGDSFALHAFPEGKLLTKATVGPVIRDQATPDGAIWAWVAFSGNGPTLSCSAGALVAATASTWRTTMPCRKVEGEKVIDLHDVDADRVLVETTSLKVLDARTGKPWTGPKAKPREAAETLDEKALAKETAATLAESPELRGMSPLILATRVLEKKHGYDVVDIGSARTVLVRRGVSYSLCELARGEPCKKVFDEGGKVTTSFSPDGERLAVASPGKQTVLDGVTGDVLFEHTGP